MILFASKGATVLRTRCLEEWNRFDPKSEAVEFPVRPLNTIGLDWPEDLGLIWVPGLPIAKGSKRLLPMKGHPGRSVVVESAKGLPGWMRSIRTECMAAGCRRVVTPLHLAAPLVLEAIFFMPRPKRPADRHATGKPDKDKLERALYDACTGMLFADDAQVVGGSSSKVYTPAWLPAPAGCLFGVRYLTR